VAAPFREAEFDIMNIGGVSKEGSLLDEAIKLEVVDKSGAFLKYDGQVIGQGREAAKKYLQDNQKIAQKIETEVKKKIKA